MGALTAYLQREFATRCPAEWSSRAEGRLLTKELESLLGYAPRADIVLERDKGSRRLWIEFEVSRADPVANHAKFATAHLFTPQASGDTFVAMVSPHVNRGRRNLASNTITLMRHIGMNAFQTVLLPQLSPEEIKRLNHLDQSVLSEADIPVEREIERVLAVSETTATVLGRHVHLVGDLTDVALNLRRWSLDLATPEGQSLWGRRTITYFVFDQRSGDFAPSKFCAYVALPHTLVSDVSALSRVGRAEMTVHLYTALADAAGSTFDGGRARRHLEGLGMLPRTPSEVLDVAQLFEVWLGRHRDAIAVHRDGPVFLCSPVWFR